MKERQKQNRADKIGLEYAKLLLERKGCKVTITGASGLIEVASAGGSNKSTIAVNTIVDGTLTGNIGVLVGQNINGRIIPAGAMVSPAEYYVFVVAGHSGVYGIETPKLRQLIQDHKYTSIETTDEELNRIAVFRQQVLLENCEHVPSPPKLFQPLQVVQPIKAIEKVKSVGPRK